jgi:hypothetical protein
VFWSSRASNLKISGLATHPVSYALAPRGGPSRKGPEGKPAKNWMSATPSALTPAVHRRRGRKGVACGLLANVPCNSRAMCPPALELPHLRARAYLAAIRYKCVLGSCQIQGLFDQRHAIKSRGGGEWEWFPDHSQGYGYEVQKQHPDPPTFEHPPRPPARTHALQDTLETKGSLLETKGSVEFESLRFRRLRAVVAYAQ